MLGGWRHGSATAQRKDTVEILKHIGDEIGLDLAECRLTVFLEVGGNLHAHFTFDLPHRASANGRRNICATSLPTRVLPAPIMPMMTARGRAVIIYESSRRLVSTVADGSAAVVTKPYALRSAHVLRPRGEIRLKVAPCFGNTVSTELIPARTSPKSDAPWPRPPRMPQARRCCRNAG